MSDDEVTILRRSPGPVSGYTLVTVASGLTEFNFLVRDGVVGTPQEIDVIKGFMSVREQLNEALRFGEG